MTTKIKKYSLHDLNGSYCHVTSNNLNEVKKECDNYLKGATVSELYKGASCWNGKIVSKFKTIYSNGK